MVIRKYFYFYLSIHDAINNVIINVISLKHIVLQPLTHSNMTPGEKEELLYLKVGSASAIGQFTSEGFVVFEGAIINEKTSAKSLSPSMIKVREAHFKAGHVDDCKTNEDLLFSSSSAAADFILGYSVSGPQTWKNKQGICLKDIENTEI